MAARVTALTMKVPASTASAPPAPIPATSAPASTGPAIIATFDESANNAFAGWSCSVSSISGNTASIAGRKNASAAPYPSWTRISARTVACPVSKSQTPPTRTNAPSESAPAPNTSPTSPAPAPWMLSTANGIATMTRRSPNTEAACPLKSNRNDGDADSGPVALAVATGPRGCGSTSGVDVMEPIGTAGSHQ